MGGMKSIFYGAHDLVEERCGGWFHGAVWGLILNSMDRGTGMIKIVTPKKKKMGSQNMPLSPARSMWGDRKDASQAKKSSQTSSAGGASRKAAGKKRKNEFSDDESEMATPNDDDFGEQQTVSSEGWNLLDWLLELWEKDQDNQVSMGAPGKPIVYISSPRNSW